VGIHMTEPMESDTEILEALEKTEKNRNWIGEHYGELRTKYEGKVFAVKDEAVIESSGNITDLLENVKKKGEDSSLLLVDSIPPKGVVYIL